MQSFSLKWNPERRKQVSLIFRMVETRAPSVLNFKIDLSKDIDEESDSDWVFVHPKRRLVSQQKANSINTPNSAKRMRDITFEPLSVNHVPMLRTRSKNFLNSRLSPNVEKSDWLVENPVIAPLSQKHWDDKFNIFSNNESYKLALDWIKNSARKDLKFEEGPTSDLFTVDLNDIHR